MFKLKKSILIGSMFFVFGNIQIFAHEPIYGNGPDVLFKGGVALGFTFNNGLGFFENEFNFGYGLTSKFTIGADIPFGNETGSYGYGGIGIRGKYRFYVDYKKGSMLEFATLGSYKFSKDNIKPNVINFGFTSGRESVEWYWFASVLYSGKVIDYIIKPGDEINYDLTFGYRLNKVNYYKPDYVVYLEFLGNHQFTSKNNNSTIEQSGGNWWAVAPTLMFTYRNYALRAGVEFGVGESGYIKRPNTNFKISFEMHI